jgi:hypothetical protein
MYATVIRTLRTEETERIRLEMNHILDIYIPEAILDCIRDLDKDLKARAVTDIQFAKVPKNEHEKRMLAQEALHHPPTIKASCSYDLLGKYPRLANVSLEGVVSLVQKHGGLKILEASLKEYFSGCDIRVGLTSYKTILVNASCKV